MSGICEPSDIVRKVNIFVNSLSSDDDLSVMQFSQCLAIVPKSERVFMEYNGWREYVMAIAPNDLDDDVASISDSDIEFLGSPGFLDQLEIKEEAFSLKEGVENESQFSILEEIFGDPSLPTSILSIDSKKGSRQKIDDWLKEMLTKSKKVTTIGTETTVVFTCCICEKVQCATYTGMKVHITKYHSDEREIFYSNGNELAQTVAASLGSASNIMPQRFQSNETTNRNEDHLWVESMVKKSEDTDEWVCGVCNVFFSKKPRGIKIHIIRSHSMSSNYRSKASRLSNDLAMPSCSTNGNNESSDNAETEKHDYDLGWINEKIEESRNKSVFGIWKCCICEKYQGQSVLGMKIHIAKTHCKSKVLETRSGDQKEDHTDRFDRNPNVVEGLLQASRTDEFKWRCSVCLNFSTTTEKGMKIHILRMHTNRESFLAETPKSASNENSNSNATEEKREWDASWIQKIADQSRAGCETWICSICLRMQAKSLHGIKVHIAKAHCLPKKDHQRDEDQYERLSDFESVADDDYDSSVNLISLNSRRNELKKKKWITQVIEKSEIVMKSDNSAAKRWICSICKQFQGDSLQGIRLHIIKRHLRNQNGQIKNLKINALPTRNDEGSGTKPQKSSDTSPTKKYHQKTSDLTQKEKIWLSDQMHKSREIIGDQNAWKCRMCNKAFSVYTSMRYHLTSKHMKQMEETLVVNDVNNGASTSHGIK